MRPSAVRQQSNAVPTLSLVASRAENPGTATTSAAFWRYERCRERQSHSRTLTPSCRWRLNLHRLAAGLSAELPQVWREALLLAGADDEAGLLDQPLRGSIEMAPTCDPAP